MAEFRKYFYALGLAALLSGSASQAFAQGNTVTCTATAGVVPVIREESFAELVGDYILDCTGGIPTPANQFVPRVDITLTLSANVTSRLLTTEFPTSNFNEALLLIDEPNTPRPASSVPAAPLRACGAPGSPDTTVAFLSVTRGDGICPIRSNGNPWQTYDGTGDTWGTFACDGLASRPTANSVGCGRPNVFQGRQGTFSAPNQIVFNGVPFDPPGPAVPDQGWNGHRILRFTNIRVAAPAAVTSSLLTAVVLSISVNASTAISLPVNIQTVANVQRGLLPITTAGRFDYVQCIEPTYQAAPSNIFPSPGGAYPTQTPWASDYPRVGFREGFVAAFKTKGIEQMLANSVSGLIFTYNNTVSLGSVANGNQNVPGALYYTESGFVSNGAAGWGNPSPNPPLGLGTAPLPGLATPLTNLNAINLAGIASQGTRIALTFRDVPAGLTISVPNVVPLIRTDDGTTISGVAVRVSTGTRGENTPSPFSSTVLITGTLNAFTFSPVTGNLAVYEILFTDPTRQEDISIPVRVTYTPNLPSNLPEPGKTAQVAGGFAPFILATDSVTTWSNSSNTLAIPRFRSSGAYTDLFRLNKCACNLLFPWVTSAGGYDTGIAIANTSLQPSASEGFNPAVQAQAGSVQFWYYTARGADTIPTQCTNTSSPGTCPGTPQLVPAGDVLTYILSQGSTLWGLDNRAAGFSGYIIAQTGFQYCHAFAYISALNAGPTTPGMSVGYLGLVLDGGSSLPGRTVQQREALDN